MKKVFTRDQLSQAGIGVRAVVASALLIVALGITELTWLVVDRPISSPLFLGAVMVTAWFCGLRLAIFVSVLSALAIDFFFISPLYGFMGSFDEIARVIVFTAEGSALSWLIDFRKKATDEITKQQEQLRALAIQQQTLREEEQKRISLEIHDELGQALTGVKIGLQIFNRKVDDQPADVPKPLVKETVSDLLTQVDNTIASVRRIATEIRPAVLDDLGLIPAIEWQAREFEQKSGVKCVVDSDFDSLDIDADATIAVFRIFQEALTNVTRHANATQVNVNLAISNGYTTFRVADNGIGLDTDGQARTQSLGILGMHERARLIGATLDVANVKNGRGTSVLLMLPRVRAVS